MSNDARTDTEDFQRSIPRRRPSTRDRFAAPLDESSSATEPHVVDLELEDRRAGAGLDSLNTIQPTHRVDERRQHATVETSTKKSRWVSVARKPLTQQIRIRATAQIGPTSSLEPCRRPRLPALLDELVFQHDDDLHRFEFQRDRLPPGGEDDHQRFTQQISSSPWLDLLALLAGARRAHATLFEPAQQPAARLDRINDLSISSTAAVLIALPCS